MMRNYSQMSTKENLKGKLQKYIWRCSANRSILSSVRCSGTLIHLLWYRLELPWLKISKSLIKDSEQCMWPYTTREKSIVSTLFPSCCTLAQGRQACPQHNDGDGLNEDPARSCLCKLALRCCAYNSRLLGSPRLEISLSHGQTQRSRHLSMGTTPKSWLLSSAAAYPTAECCLQSVLCGYRKASQSWPKTSKPSDQQVLATFKKDCFFFLSDWDYLLVSRSWVNCPQAPEEMGEVN